MKIDMDCFAKARKDRVDCRTLFAMTVEIDCRTSFAMTVEIDCHTSFAMTVEMDCRTSFAMTKVLMPKRIAMRYRTRLNHPLPLQLGWEVVRLKVCSLSYRISYVAIRDLVESDANDFYTEAGGS